MRHHIDLAVFDIIGTTVEDRGETEESFTRALASVGVSLGSEAFALVRGMSKREALSNLISGNGSVEDAYERFLEELGARYDSDGASLLPGISGTFAHLKAVGVKLALNTGLDRAVVEILLQRIPSLTVDAVVCGDEVTRGRPFPYLIFRAMERTAVSSVHRVLSVGDTIRDLEAGANAGVRYNVGVLSGAHDRARLEAAPHTHILDSVSELESILSL